MNIRPIAAALAAVALTSASAMAGETAAPTGYQPPPGVALTGPGDHVADGVVKKGDTIASAPIAFRRTGVAAADVTGFTFTVKGVLAPKGSPAIYLGPAGLSFGGQTRGRGEFWCFLPSRAGGKRESLCLAVMERMSAIGPNNANPYLFHGFTPQTGTPNWANNPVITEGPVELGEVKLEYRIGGWSKRFVTVDIYAGGLKGDEVLLPRAADGSVLLRTPSGVLNLKPDREGARVVTVTEAR